MSAVDPRPVVLVSACLCGVACRYHGRPMPVHSRVRKLLERGDVRIVQICPEVDAGMPVPRPGTYPDGAGHLVCDGCDVSADFHRGAVLALATAAREHAGKAYLVRGSPSCDRDSGVTGKLLSEHGIRVIRV